MYNYFESGGPNANKSVDDYYERAETVDKWALSDEEIEWSRELANALGYKHEDMRAWGSAWLSATTDLLVSKGADRTTINQWAQASPLVLLDLGDDVSTEPMITCIVARSSHATRSVEERYREAAADRVDEATGLVKSEHIAELHARTAALWQRLNWEVERLSGDDQLEGWMLATWFEVKSGRGQRSEEVLQRWRRMIASAYFRRPPLQDLESDHAIPTHKDRWVWEDVLYNVYDGARMQEVLPRVWTFLNDSLRMNETFCRAQLSGLAYILNRRSQCLDRILEFVEGLRIYGGLLEAAILDIPALSDKALAGIRSERATRAGQWQTDGIMPEGIRWTHPGFARLVVERYYTTGERSWKKAHDEEDEAQRHVGGSPFADAVSFEKLNRPGFAGGSHP